MKKLNLNVADFGATEILSREELKKVLGGTESEGSSSGSCNDYYCWCDGHDKDCQICGSFYIRGCSTEEYRNSKITELCAEHNGKGQCEITNN